MAMKTMMDKVDAETTVNFVLLGGYRMELGKIEFGTGIKQKLVEMIRSAVSTEEARAHLDKYESRVYDARFDLYPLSSKIRVIRESREILDYFGMDYPDFPESIKGLFEG